MVKSDYTRAYFAVMWRLGDRFLIIGGISLIHILPLFVLGHERHDAPSLSAVCHDATNKSVLLFGDVLQLTAIAKIP